MIWQRSLCILLSLEIALAAPVQAIGRTSGETAPARLQSPPVSSASNLEMSDVSMMLGCDPTNAFLERPPMVTPNWSGHERSLDANPFFLRSQAWAQRGSIQSDVGFSVESTSRGLQIGSSTMAQDLQLNENWVLIAETPQYLIFTAATDNPVFERAAAENGITESEHINEGLFVIAKIDLVSRSLLPIEAEAARHVPVFFFPMPGRGWRGPLRTLQLEPGGTLAIFSENQFGGEAMPIAISDIDLVVKVETLNLLLATAQTMPRYAAENAQRIRNSFQALQPNYQLRYGLPPPGSTSGFGMFPSMTALPSSSTFGEVLSRFLLPKAQAAGLPDDVTSKLTTVGIVIAAAYLGAIIAKYAFLRDRFKESRFIDAHGEEIRNVMAEHRLEFEAALNIVKAKYDFTQIKMPLGFFNLRDQKEIIDSFAHMLTTFDTAVRANGFYLFEWLIDKGFGKYAAGKNHWLQRFFDKTFRFSVNSITSLPVNAKTFWLGAIVMGGVDVAFVVLQTLLFMPWVAPHLASVYGIYGDGLKDYLLAKSAETFQPGNQTTATANLGLILSNAVVYLTRGASMYSEETRVQTEASVRKMVDDALRAEGKNPQDLRYKNERALRITQENERRAMALGLPSGREFLFDANSLRRRFGRAIGYGANPDVIDANELDAFKRDQRNNNFILAQSRWPLVAQAMRDSIQEAKRWEHLHPSGDTRALVELLESHQRKLSFVGNIIQNPTEPRLAIRETCEARQMLTNLSYQGPIEPSMRYIPELWQGTSSPTVAKAAGFLFRTTLLGYLEGNKGMINSQVAEGLPAFVAKDKSLAEKEENLSILERKIESTVEYTNHVAQVEQDRHDDSYKPPLSSWYKKKEDDWATQEALAQLRQTHSDLELAHLSEQPESVQQEFRRHYTRALAKNVGLYFDWSANDDSFINKVEEKTAEQFQKQVEKDSALQKYLSRLPMDAKFRVLTQTYAVVFLTTYNEMAKDGETLEALAPEQPGRFQKLRQSQFVRKSRFLTKALRFAEGFFDNDAHKPGLRSRIGRSVPFTILPLPPFVGSDFAMGFIRALKGLPMLYTLTYLSYRLIWQVHIPYSTYMLYFVGNVMIGATIQVIYRILANLGIRPMEDMWSKIKYATLFSWLTCFSLLPIQLFSGDMSELASQFMQWIENAFGNVTTTEVATTAAVGGAGFLGWRSMRNAWREWRKRSKQQKCTEILETTQAATQTVGP